MCIEAPAQVISVDPEGLCAMVSAEHGTQPALLLALDPNARPVQPGDWLIVHSGLAVERISVDEARDLLELMGQARSMDEAR
jgi:hydrogenase expression/formation protein HypC